MSTIPAIWPQSSAVDRRAFLSGAWLENRGPAPSSPRAHNATATVHVQARPHRLGEVKRRLESIGACRIGGSSSTTLQVDIRLSEAVNLAAVLDTIAAVPDVLAATLAGRGLPEAAE